VQFVLRCCVGLFMVMAPSSLVFRVTNCVLMIHLTKTVDEFCSIPAAVAVNGPATQLEVTSEGKAASRIWPRHGPPVAPNKA
jgi:hypothetical protein